MSAYMSVGKHSFEVTHLDTGGAVMPLGDSTADAIEDLFSDEVAARSDEDLFKIATQEATDTENQDLSLF